MVDVNNNEQVPEKRSRAQAFFALSQKLKQKEDEVAELTKQIEEAEERAKSAEQALDNVVTHTQNEIDRLNNLLDEANATITQLQSQIKILSSAHAAVVPQLSPVDSPLLTEPPKEEDASSPKEAVRVMPSLDVKDETAAEGLIPAKLDRPTPVISLKPATPAAASSTTQTQTFELPTFELPVSEKPQNDLNLPDYLKQSPFPSTSTPMEPEEVSEHVDSIFENAENAAFADEEAAEKKPRKSSPAKKILLLVGILLGVFVLAVVVFFLSISMINGISPAEAVSALLMLIEG